MSIIVLPTSPAEKQNQEVTKQSNFELWNNECDEEDWMLVNVENSSCRRIPVEESFTFRRFVAETAEDFYYAIYDEAKGKLSTIVAEKVFNWSRRKSKNRDGVIYIFRKLQGLRHAETGSISFDTFRGASTKIRLELIQASTDISLEIMQASKEKRSIMI
ncbi:MAG: hypothetical protein Q9178_007333 [Gyalolechia marmorata]